MNIKYSFLNDYSEGAHPEILKLLEETNTNQEIGYGEDSYSRKAASLIKDLLQSPQSAIHFVSGGTQANLIVLGSLLKPYEAVIAPETGHINVHEAGAIEAIGHKIISLPATEGKITPAQIEKVVHDHSDEHMVQPKVVFISQATELGTVYTKSDLSALHEICQQHQLYLYLDGARLGSAIMSIGSDINLSDLTKLVDVFYIGGTKNGALFGEAIVVVNPYLQANFRRHLKQRGALLAKGRSISVQFLALFTNHLYFDLAKHANDLAAQLTQGIKDLGYTFLTPSPTNQIFPIFPNDIVKKLHENYLFYDWSKVDDNHTSIRLVTSWATPESAITDFLQDLKSLT